MTLFVQRSIDMRYRYQSHELNVPLPPGVSELTASDMTMLDAAFDKLYELTYGPGSGYRDAGKEIVTYRVSASGIIGKPEIRKGQRGAQTSAVALKSRRPVFFEEANVFMETPIYDFQRLLPGPPRRRRRRRATTAGRRA